MRFLTIQLLALSKDQQKHEVFGRNDAQHAESVVWSCYVHWTAAHSPHRFNKCLALNLCCILLIPHPVWQSCNLQLPESAVQSRSIPCVTRCSRRIKVILFVIRIACISFFLVHIKLPRNGAQCRHNIQYRHNSYGQENFPSYVCLGVSAICCHPALVKTVFLLYIASECLPLIFPLRAGAVQLGFSLGTN